MPLQTKEADGVLVVRFGDAKLVDDQVINRTGRELTEVVSQVGEEKKAVLSFQGVIFMSSAMLGRLVTFHKVCKKAEVDLKLCSISADIMEVFKITRLDKLFDIQKDEDKAVKAFNKKGWFGW